MRRTMERSQRVEQRQKRWSWGGLSTDSEGRTGTDPQSCYSEVCVKCGKKAAEGIICGEEHDQGWNCSFDSPPRCRLPSDGSAGISVRQSDRSSFVNGE